MSQEVSGPRRAVWDQADMQVRVSWEDDGDCNVGKMREECDESQRRMDLGILRVLDLGT